MRWNELLRLKGNKWNRALHPAMVSKAGYQITAKTREVGDSKYGSKYSIVKYDREYVIGWIGAKVIRPISTVGFVGILKIVKEAYTTMYPHSTSVENTSDESYLEVSS